VDALAISAPPPGADPQRSLKPCRAWPRADRGTRIGFDAVFGGCVSSRGHGRYGPRSLRKEGLMPDATPLLDATTVRRAITRAQHEVCDALRQIAAFVGTNDTTLLSVDQRQAARTLNELGREASHLRSVELSSTDTQLLQRTHELKSSADEITTRLCELRTFAPRKPDDLEVPDQPLRAALGDLLDAIDATDHQLATAAPDEHDPYAWLWEARLLSFALDGFGHLLAQLTARAARSLIAMNAYNARQAATNTRAETAAVRAHLAAVSQRLHAAGCAARLAARRANLVELHELVHNWPRTELQIDDTPIEITLRTQKPAKQYEIRANHRAYPDHFTSYTARELTAAIAAGVGLDLGDLAQRRRAHDAAKRSRQQLAAIVAYRDSTRRGDPQDAANSPDPAAPQIPDVYRPDSRRDLTDLLLDLTNDTGQSPPCSKTA
jgi:hypothetical protein